MRDSTSALVCRDREGCTLWLSLRPRKGNHTFGSIGALKKPLEKNYVISGLRILVGSSSKETPSKIYIQGRPIELIARLKKWYSIPLTDEEVALGVRNGSVSVGIGPSLDSSSDVVVDALEVYATARESIESWLPTSYIHPKPYKGREVARFDNMGGDVQGLAKMESEALLRSTETMMRLIAMFQGPMPPLELMHINFFNQLVRDTAVGCQKHLQRTIHDLAMKLCGGDELGRISYTENILVGCSQALTSAQEMYERTDTTEGNEVIRWKAIRAVLRDCVQLGITISSSRPMEYLQSSDNIANRSIGGALAMRASNLILTGIRRSLPCDDFFQGTGNIIDLCLMEMALELTTGRGKNFAKFDLIRKFLESGSSRISEMTCRAITAFCKRHEPKDESMDFFSQLQETRLVAYKCDSCGICPMKEVRYTVLDDSFDIE